TFVRPTAASGHTSGLAPESFIFPAELSDWSRREVLPYFLQMNFPPTVPLFARTLESICGFPACLIFATVSATRSGATQSANSCLHRDRADWRISKTCSVSSYDFAGEPQNPADNRHYFHPHPLNCT